MTAKGDRYLQLDGIRGLAMLSVLVGHTLESSLGDYSRRVVGWGECGVMLFFVLSGYLITNLLIREEERTGRIDVRTFYIRRALRLLPAMFLYVGTIFVLKLVGVVQRESWGSIAASVLYVRNLFGRGHALAQLWSLSLEEQFYLTWPAVFILARRRRVPVIVAVMLVGAAWRALAISTHLTNVTTGRVYEATWFRFDSIIYGCFLAVMSARDPAWGRGLLARRLCHPAITLPLLALATSVDASSAFSPVALTVQSVATTGFLWHVLDARPESPTYRAFASWPMRYLGRISYSLYLWQGLFVYLPGQADEPAFAPLRSLPLGLGLTFVAAIASHELFERPFLKLKERFTPARSGLAAPVAVEPAAAAPSAAAL
jgi:peptidoglycan/LPS O-acetylase OafA/YrhL